MAELGLPFQGRAWYWVESSYGDSSATDGDITELPISCKIQDMRYGIGDKHKVLRGFDAPNACHLLEQCSDLTLHLEYIPQCDDTLIEDVCNRTAEMKLQSLGFVLGTNRWITTATDKSSFAFFGCKPKTIRISSSINNEYLITIDFSVKEVQSCQSDMDGLDCVSACMASEPAALTGDYLAFNVAGSITKDGADFAYIADSIDITINHNLTDKYFFGSLVKQYCIEGAVDYEGTIDISLDEGGRSHEQEILNQTAFDVVVNLGGAGCPVITLNNCKWLNGEFDVNVSGDILADSARFTGKPTDGEITAIVS